VVEGVNLAQPLIKKLLGLRVAGRDPMVKIAIAGHQGGRFRWRGRGMVLRYCQAAHRNHEWKDEGVPHFELPPGI
jgi:hypothetical protein